MMKHENNVTLSVYVNDITCKVYDEKADTVTEKTYLYHKEKTPSETILKKEIEEKFGDTVLKVKSISLNNELSGLYEMTHEEFIKYGRRIGEVREKKVKE